MTEESAPLPAVIAPLAGALRVAHWTITNGSGMHRVAESLAKAETVIGLDSFLADPTNPETWEAAKDADVHVLHTHFPTQMKDRLTKPFRLVWVGHGTPEHVFENSVEDALQGSYGHGDGMMLLMHWIKVANARVTFWDRHKWVYDQFISTGARLTDCVPLGVDLAFWKAGSSAGKFAGDPSVFTAENPHRIKWPLDLFMMWPDIYAEYPGASLHACYLPRDMHRTFFPFINQNGAAFGAHVGPTVFDAAGLRNAFKSVDWFIGLVRYGDLNHLSLQANAAGSRTISYRGNPHADYWITEGDQREMVKELKAILGGEVSPRDKTPVPDILDTVKAMKAIYEAIL